MRTRAIIITLSLFLSTNLFSAPISYIFSGLLTGFDFNTQQQITNAPATFTVKADTSTLMPDGPSPIVTKTPFLGYTLVVDGQSVQEGSPGSYGALFAGGGSVSLFTTNEPEVIISFSSPVLSNYDLTTAIGPVAGAAVTNPDGFTSGGIITAPDGGGLALQAFTGRYLSTATMVPEPSSGVYGWLSISIFAAVISLKRYSEHRFRS